MTERQTQILKKILNNRIVELEQYPDSSEKTSYKEELEQIIKELHKKTYGKEQIVDLLVSHINKDLIFFITKDL